MASSICCCSSATIFGIAWLTSWALVPAAQAACRAALPGGKVLTIACKAFNLRVISPGLVAGRAMASSICCCLAAIKAAIAWLTSWALVPAAQTACWAALPMEKVLTIARKGFNFRGIFDGERVGGGKGGDIGWCR